MLGGNATATAISAGPGARRTGRITPRSRFGGRQAGVLLAVLILILPSCQPNGRTSSAPKVSPSNLPGVFGGSFAGAGTLTTVAGPGYCAGSGKADPYSTTVRSLDLDVSTGAVFVDTGPRARGTVGRIDPGGRSVLADTGAKGGSDPLSTFPRLPSVSSAGRISADGRGGTYVSSGKHILHIQSDAVGVTTLGAELPAGGSSGLGPSSRRGFIFDGIRSIASDDAGSLYVADSFVGQGTRFKIRFVNLGGHPVTFYGGTPHEIAIPPNEVRTIAGEGVGGNGAPTARAASLSGIPPALAVSGQKLYFSSLNPQGRLETSDGRARIDFDEGESVIEMINLGRAPLKEHGLEIAPGGIGRIAGSRSGFSGDGGDAKVARLSYVPGMSATSDGGLIFADELNHRVRKIDARGQIATVAGTGPAGAGRGEFSGNGGPAVAARLNRPYGVAAGPDGRVYISDKLNRQVRVIEPEGSILPFPGAGVGLSWLCGGGSGAPRKSPSPGVPSRVDSLAVSGGVPYFSPSQVAGIIKISGDRTRVVSRDTDAGSLLATHPRGGIYALEPAQGGIKLVNISSRTIKAHGKTVPPGSSETVLDGTSGSVAGAPEGIRSILETASSLAFAGSSLYAASSSLLLEVDRDGKVRVVPLNKSTPCCVAIQALWSDGSSKLYVGENRSPGVWLLNLGSSPIRAYGETVAPGDLGLIAGRPDCALALEQPAGCFGFGGDGGSARQAEFRQISGLAVDGKGNLYVSDMQNHSVRRVDASGTVVTIAGTGQAGFNGDGQPADFTMLSSPAQLTFDRCGNLLINDRGNRRIRRLNLVPAERCRS